MTSAEMLRRIHEVRKAFAELEGMKTNPLTGAYSPRPQNGKQAYDVKDDRSGDDDDGGGGGGIRNRQDNEPKTSRVGI